MSWWTRLIGGRSDDELKPQRLDYLSEALVLERQGDYDAALTSYRLALRDKPDDHRVLMNMAIAYSRLTRLGEAERCYRRVLEVKPDHSGAHYGLASSSAGRARAAKSTRGLRECPRQERRSR
jgi:Flp pilus assembly protein TadD